MNPNPIKTHKRCGGVVDVLSCTSCGAFPLEDDDILTISTENPNPTPEEIAEKIILKHWCRHVFELENK